MKAITKKLFADELHSKEYAAELWTKILREDIPHRMRRYFDKQTLLWVVAEYPMIDSHQTSFNLEIR